jgi:hypothetical protein
MSKKTATDELEKLRLTVIAMWTEMQMMRNDLTELRRTISYDSATQTKILATLYDCSEKFDGYYAKNVNSRTSTTA